MEVDDAYSGCVTQLCKHLKSMELKIDKQIMDDLMNSPYNKKLASLSKLLANINTFSAVACSFQSLLPQIAAFAVSDAEIEKLNVTSLFYTFAILHNHFPELKKCVTLLLASQHLNDKFQNAHQLNEEDLKSLLQGSLLFHSQNGWECPTFATEFILQLIHNGNNTNLVSLCKSLINVMSGDNEFSSELQTSNEFTMAMLSLPLHNLFNDTLPTIESDVDDNGINGTMAIDGRSTRHFLLTDSMASHVKNMYMATAAKLPIIVQGTIGVGKTALVEYFAEIHGKIKSPDFMKIQLADETDAKALIGMYVCGDSPGEFKWQEGPLTLALKHGAWLLLEDIDHASPDVLSVITSLLQYRKLTIPSSNQDIPMSDDFQVFFTRRLVAGHRRFMTNNHIEALCIKIELMTIETEDISKVVTYCYPELSEISMKLASTFSLLCGETTTIIGRLNSSAKVHSKRIPTMRQFMRWVKRIANRLSHVAIDSINEDVFMDAMHCFCDHLRDTNDALIYSSTLATQFSISKPKLEYIMLKYKPSIDISYECLTIGRAVIQRLCNDDEDTIDHSNFAFTKHSLKLMENLGLCISQNEPVLIVGETGCGKTATVQYLAKQCHQKLHVVNMSQQSDLSDLLGGYKPTSTKALAEPIRKEFEALFLETFSKKQNIKFLNHVNTCAVRQEWDMLLKIMMHAINSAVKQKSCTNAQVWENLGAKIQSLLDQISKKNLVTFNYVDGALVKAIQHGHWVLLDEINLAAPETLEYLSCLLDSESGSVILTEKGNAEPIQRHENFRIFACMNPATDVGKKDLPTSIRNRFTEIYVDEMESDADLMLLVSHYLKNVSMPKNVIRNIVRFYQTVRAERMKKSNQKEAWKQKAHYSLRTLCRALDYIVCNPHIPPIRCVYEGICCSFLTQLSHEAYPLMVELIKEEIFKEIPKGSSCLKAPLPKPPGGQNHSKVAGYWLTTGDTEIITDQKYILTTTVERNLKNLCRVVSARKHPVLLQGPTSVGKTSLIHFLANRTGNRCVRINNHEHTDIQEYTGCYATDAFGKLYFRDGVLVDAMRKGYWLILDELNLAPSDVLEALNRVLDDNRELFIAETQEVVKAHPKFVLFATQNPPGEYSGRKLLSRAFRNRFVELEFKDIPMDELQSILHQRCDLPLSYCKKFVSALHDLQIQRKKSGIFAGKHGFMTLRDLFRWAERYRQSTVSENVLHDWDQQLANDGYLLLAGRCRSVDEQSVVQNVIEKCFKRKIIEDELFSLERKSCILRDADKILALSSKQFPHLVWTKNLCKLAVLMGRALQFHEPVLLVGETGCGKTTTCEMFSSVFNQTLFTLNCHMHTEASDFLGGLRPVRQRSDEDNQNLFEWVNGPLVTAMVTGAMMLIDEISLADDSVLERMNSILEPERCLLLAEKGSTSNSDGAIDVIKADEKFCLVATMNPGGDYGKKELSPALRNRFTEIWCPSVFIKDDIIAIVNHNLTFQTADFDVARSMVQFVDYLATTRMGKRLQTSVRDILAWTNFMNIFSSNDKKLDARLMFIHGSHLVFLDAIGFGNTWLLDDNSEMSNCHRLLSQLCGIALDDFHLTGSLTTTTLSDGTVIFGIDPFHIECGPLMNKDCTDDKYVLDSSGTRQNVLKLLRAMQLARPILLEGSPGAGKTSVVHAIAKATGHPIVRINLSDQTDITDLFGTDLPVEGTDGLQFAWRDGPFLQALKTEKWIILDELNLASQSVLEGLNACFDHRGEIYIPELGKTFKVKKGQTRIFACQNPLSQGGGRKGLPKSFLNRFSKVYIDPLSDTDLRYILKSTFADLDDCLISKMVDFNKEINKVIMIEKRFGQKGSPWEFNVRDLSRWCQLMTAAKGCKPNPGLHFPLIYQSRMRTKEDKKEMMAAFKRVFNDDTINETIDTNCLAFNLNEDFVQIGTSLLRRKHCQLDESSSFPNCRLLTSQLQSMERLAKCIEMNWLAILVGREATGKSTLPLALSALTGNELKVLCVNNSMDTTELLGSFEQVDLLRRFEYGYQNALSVLSTEASVLREREDLNNLCNLVKLTNVFKSSGIQLLDGMKSKSGSQTNSSHTAVDELWNQFEHFLAAVLNNLKELQTGAHNTMLKLNEDLRHVRQLFCSAGYTAHIRGQFEWVNGTLIEALTKGHWLLIDDVNICNPSVLDRLNALMEPNGVLRIDERGVTDGDVPIIRPHPDFRMIFAMNPANGEISRAMRNRGLEIHLDDELGINVADLVSVYGTLPYSLVRDVCGVHNEMASENKAALHSISQLAKIVRSASNSKKDLKTVTPMVYNTSESPETINTQDPSIPQYEDISFIRTVQFSIPQLVNASSSGMMLRHMLPLLQQMQYSSDTRSNSSLSGIFMALLLVVENAPPLRVLSYLDVMNSAISTHNNQLPSNQSITNVLTCLIKLIRDVVKSDFYKGKLMDHFQKMMPLLDLKGSYSLLTSMSLHGALSLVQKLFTPSNTSNEFSEDSLQLSGDSCLRLWAAMKWALEKSHSESLLKEAFSSVPSILELSSLFKQGNVAKDTIPYPELTFFGDFMAVFDDTLFGWITSNENLPENWAECIFNLFTWRDLFQSRCRAVDFRGPMTSYNRADFAIDWKFLRQSLTIFLKSLPQRVQGFGMLKALHTKIDEYLFMDETFVKFQQDFVISIANIPPFLTQQQFDAVSICKEIDNLLVFASQDDGCDLRKKLMSCYSALLVLPDCNSNYEELLKNILEMKDSLQRLATDNEKTIIKHNSVEVVNDDIILKQWMRSLSEVPCLTSLEKAMLNQYYATHGSSLITAKAFLLFHEWSLAKHATMNKDADTNAVKLPLMATFLTLYAVRSHHNKDMDAETKNPLQQFLDSKQDCSRLMFSHFVLTRKAFENYVDFHFVRPRFDAAYEQLPGLSVTINNCDEARNTTSGLKKHIVNNMASICKNGCSPLTSLLSYIMSIFSDLLLGLLGNQQLEYTFGPDDFISQILQQKVVSRFENGRIESAIALLLNCLEKALTARGFIPGSTQAAFARLKDTFSNIQKKTNDFSHELSDDCQLRFIAPCGIMAAIGACLFNCTVPASLFDPVNENARLIESLEHEIAKIDAKLHSRYLADSIWFGTSGYEKDQSNSQLHNFSSNPFVVKVLLARRSQLQILIDETEVTMAVRPNPPQYQQLLDKFNHYVDSVGDPCTLCTLIDNLCEVIFRLSCIHLGNTTDVFDPAAVFYAYKSIRSKAATWQQSTRHFMASVHELFPMYKDCTAVCLSGLAQVEFALTHILCVADDIVRMSSCYQTSSAMANQNSLCFELIERLSRCGLNGGLPLDEAILINQSTDFIYTICSTDTGCSEDKAQFMIWHTVLSHAVNHHMLTNQVDASVIKCTKSVWSAIADMLRKEDNAKTLKEKEENQLYKFKVINAMPNEEELDEDGAYAFPTYAEQYADILPKESFDEDLSATVTTDVRGNDCADVSLETFKFYSALSYRSKTNNLELQDKHLKAVIYQSFWVASMLTDGLDFNTTCHLDSVLGPSHLMMSHNLASSLASNEQLKSLASDFNIYEDSHIPTALAIKTLLSKFERSLDDLLTQFPDHPVILQLKQIIKRILSFSLTSPLMKLLTGLEILLKQAQEWEQYSSKQLSLQAELELITNQIIDLRKSELRCWKQLLNNVERKEREAISKWWHHIYLMVQEFLIDQCNKFWESEVFSSLKEFVESSSLGDFKARLDMLQSFHDHLLLESNSTESHSQDLCNGLSSMISYYGLFLEPINDHVTTFRQKIDKDLQDFIKVARWNDINYWAMRQANEKSHRKLKKFTSKFSNILREPALPHFKLKVKVNQDESRQTAFIDANDLKHLITKEAAIIEEQNVTIDIKVAGDCVRSESVQKLASKMVKKFMTLVKKDVFCSDGVHVNEFIGGLINEVKTLRALNIDKVPKEKKESAQKQINNRKRNALWSLYKVLKSLGLSYRKGLIDKDLDPMHASVSILPNEFNAISQFKDIQEKTEQIIDSCQSYHMRCLAKDQVFAAKIALPSKDLAPPEVQRCHGFTRHVQQCCMKQRLVIKRQLATLSNLRFSSASLAAAVNDNTSSNGSRPILPPQLATSKAMIDLDKLCHCIMYSVRMFLLYAKCDVAESSAGVEDLANSVIAAVTLLSRKTHQRSKDLSKPELPTLATWSDVQMIADCSKCLQELHHTLTEMISPWQYYDERTVSITSGVSNIIKDIAEFIDETSDLIKTQEKISMHTDEVEPPSQHANTFQEVILSALNGFQEVMMSLRNNTPAPKTGEDDMSLDNKLVPSLVNNLFSTLDKLNADTLELKLCTFINDLKLSYATEAPQSSNEDTLLCYWKALNVILTQYINTFTYHLLELLQANHVTSKLCYVLLSIFTDLAEEGFCIPDGFSDATDDARTDFNDATDCGMGEGEGAKDVSDQIESQDQLHDTHREEDKKKEEEENDEPDVKNEENGIEMNDDFDADLQDVDGDERESDDNEDQPSDDEDDLDKQMGDVEENEPPLNEKFWGDSDDEEDNEEPQGDKEEKGPGADPTSESQLVANEENAGEQEGNDRDEESNEINNDADDHEHDENDEFDFDKNDKEEETPADVNETHEKQTEEEEGKQDETMEDDDINGDLDLDEEEDEKNEENADDENKAETEADVDEATEETEEETTEKDDEGEDASSVQGTDDQQVTDTKNSETAESCGNDAEMTECETNDDTNDQGDNKQNATLMPTDGDQGQLRRNQSASRKPEKRSRQPKESQEDRTLADYDSAKDHKRAKTTDEKMNEDDTNEMEVDPVENITGEYQHHDEGTVEVIDTATAEQAKEQRMRSQPKEVEGEDEKETGEGSDSVNKDAVESAQQKIDESNTTDVDNKEDLEKMEDDAIADTDDDNDDKQLADEYLNTLPRETQTFFSTSDASITALDLLERNHDCNLEDLRAELESHIGEVADNVSKDDMRSALDTWINYETLTAHLARDLCEQLRLVLEPTVASKMTGDFRSGKRLSMRKVIPYIASQYRKDKIWLRRSKKSKRDYHVMLAVDDSSSMADNHSKQIAFESLAVISNALRWLEVGRFAVSSFGDTIQMHHDFFAPFNEDSGASILQSLTFDQKKTKVAKLMHFASVAFSDARQASSSAAAISQLLLIVSDGRGIFVEGKEAVLRSIADARQRGIFTVFVIVDNPRNRDSVLDIKVPIFDPSSSAPPKIESYMDSFPFPFYVVLRDVDSLPSVLSDALRQWFEMVSQE